MSSSLQSQKTTEHGAARKEHARADALHGHWLKDLEIWERQYSELAEHLQEIRRSIDLFKQRAPSHRKTIEEHRRLEKVHDQIISDYEKTGKESVHDECMQIHSEQNASHERELKSHEELKKIHEDIKTRLYRMNGLLGRE